MSYRLSEPIPNTVLAYLEGDLKMEHIVQLNQEVVTKYFTDDAGSYYIIYEVSDLKTFPTGIVDLRKASEPIATHPALKYQVITGLQSPIFKFLVNMIGQLFRQNLKKANSVEEAITFVQSLQSNKAQS